jgi:hypothetical protein
MLISEFSLLKSGQCIEPFDVIFTKFFAFKYNNIMWFFVPLIICYISTPYITIFVINANRKILKQFILLALALNFCESLYYLIEPSDGNGTLLNIYMFGTKYLLFIVAGYYIGNFEISINKRKLLYIIATVSVVIMAVGTAYLHFNCLSRYRFFIRYTNLPCTLLAFAIFCMFKNADWERICRILHINGSMLAKLSSLSLGIYLIQMFWFIFIGKFSFIPQQGFTCFLIMYFLCIVSVWLIKKLPILKHTV